MCACVRVFYMHVSECVCAPAHARVCLCVCACVCAYKEKGENAIKEKTYLQVHEDQVEPLGLGGGDCLGAVPRVLHPQPQLAKHDGAHFGVHRVVLWLPCLGVCV